MWNDYCVKWIYVYLNKMKNYKYCIIKKLSKIINLIEDIKKISKL